MATLQLSYLDLYFYCALAEIALRDRWQLIDRYVIPLLGKEWYAETCKANAVYRAAVDTVIREAMEQSTAIAAAQQPFDKTAQWRRFCESMARQASPQKRKLLLQTAGFGLGNPRTVKELKDLLVTVKARMAANQAEFTRLGAGPEVLAYPEQALVSVEKLTAEVAREKAEGEVARTEAAAQRTELGARYDAIDKAVTSAKAGAEFAGDGAAHKKLAELEIALAKALGEARVQALGRAADGTLPPALTANLVATDGSGNDGADI